MAPSQTPQRLNRLIGRSAEWPELSGARVAHTRARLSACDGHFHFFVFLWRTLIGKSDEYSLKGQFSGLF
jgi:hypothetical protein